MNKIECFNAVDDTIIEEELLSESEKHLINLCCKIRRAANSNNVVIDKTEHRDSDNLHLFRFIELCNYSVDEFVLRYLRNLQPFSLREDASQKYDKKIICVISLGFKYCLYVKVDTTQFCEIVVSFHEDQFYSHRGNEFSGLLLGGVKSEVGEFSSQTIAIPWGFKIFHIGLFCQCVKEGVFRCEPKILSNYLVNEANNFLADCLNNQQVFTKFNNLKQISFTSYGESILNEISILIDYASYCRNPNDVTFATIALTSRFEILQNFPDYEEYKKALLERYSKKIPDNERALIVLGLFI